MKPIAFVIPWYGEDLKGGAEQFAWQFSHRLAGRGHAVEVLTTCCASFLEDWNQNHLEVGEDVTAGNVLVRRFEVRARNTGDFHGANMRLLDIPLQQLSASGYTPDDADSEIFIRDNIRSEGLNRFIEQHSDDYHAFIFIPYMYGPTFDGLPLVAGKAFLHPCLHDEAYAYLPQVEDLFLKCRGILYNSSGERYLAEHLYGPGIHNKGVVVGGGVEIAPGASCADYQVSVAGVDVTGSPYVLYLGRRDTTKNTDMLVQAFREHKLSFTSSDIRLYLAGPGSRSYSDERFDILDFGLVSEQEKESLLQNCVALAQPSSNESYSRTIMEAWLYSRPVLVHRNCLATADPVEQAKGGWMAGDKADWVALLGELNNASMDEIDAMGERGREYAREFASWDRTMDRYEQALGLGPGSQVSSDHDQGSLRRIIQLTAGITYGDAISNQAMFIRDYLRQSGYESEILVEVMDSQCADEARLYAEGALEDADAIIYHHSIGSSLSSACVEFRGPRVLIYHNITPARFFAPYDLRIARLLEDGRRELAQIISAFPCLYADSEYNAQEIRAAGAQNCQVLPIAVDPGLWEQTPCEQVLAHIGDGRRNILFVGRISPNKNQRELVLAFQQFRVLDPESRLILVGGYDTNDEYFRQLRQSVDMLGLADDVLIAGKVSQEELHAYYCGSHLFWSMSDHEGFGVPLVESMWFELPVMAYKSSAVPETLGEGGILFDDKQNHAELAFLAARLLHDKRLRADLIAGQRRRRMDFHPDKVRRSVDEVLAALVQQTGGGSG